MSKAFVCQCQSRFWTATALSIKTRPPSFKYTAPLAYMLILLGLFFCNDILFMSVITVIAMLLSHYNNMNIDKKGNQRNEPLPICCKRVT